MGILNKVQLQQQNLLDKRLRIEETLFSVAFSVRSFFTLLLT